MSHPYFTRPKELTGRVELQDRDVKIIQAVYEHRLLDTKALALLLGHQGNLRMLEVRLRKLYDYAFLDRPRSQLAWRVGLGASPGEEERCLIYALGVRGAKYLADQCGEPLETLRWSLKNRELGPWHIKHTLGVARCRVAVRLGVPDDLPMQGTDDYSKPYFLGGKQGDEIKAQVVLPSQENGKEEQATITPDWFFGIQKPKAAPNRSYFFLEYQRTTDFKRFLRAKGLAFRAAWKQGVYESLGIKGFRVLIVGQTRRKTEALRTCIKKWLTEVTEQPSGMWLFTAEECYREQPRAFLTESIWQTASDDRLLSLLE